MTDWDDAFDNVGHVPNALGYFETWKDQAKAFRDCGIKQDLSLAYGPADRQKLDIFWPDTKPKGLVIFIHGGYWIRLDRSYFSHLAAGPLANGWAVAVPSYTLAPEARISGMTREIAQAITFAANKVDGPIRIAGHSAGGHLATRMICKDSPIDTVTQNRIVKTVSISGLHDLRNLLKINLNEILQLTPSEATIESPCLNTPVENAKATCWVGSIERPEFIRQNHLLRDHWAKYGTDIDVYIDDMKHHFDVIDSLEQPDSQLVRSLLS